MIPVRHALALLSLLLAPAALAGALPVALDGEFGDWAAVSPLVTDASGDGGASGIDFGRLWAANDAEHLYLRFEQGAEVILQETNPLVLYLDTDANAGTGIAVAGMGADLVWEFGSRNGTYRGSTVYWDDIGLVSMPSHSATGFEIMLRRDAVAGGQPLFPGSTVHIALRDEGAGGDWLPSSTTHAAYVFDDSNPQTPPALGLGRNDPSHLRLVSFNVLFDGLWDRPSPHTRIHQAIAPDVIAYQEIYDHSATATRTWVEGVLGGTWYADGPGELQIVSRYPVLQAFEIAGGRGRATLIDLPVSFGHDLLVVNLHLKCCGGYDWARQDQIDEIMAFVRDAMQPGGALTLDADTPVVILGDTNMYGDAGQVHTLLTGDIADNGSFGPDFAPDWDGGDLEPLLSPRPGSRHTYTWYNDGSSFGPSHIDRVALTGSVIQVPKSYILDTRVMTALELANTGLQAGDSDAASDHMPHVVDLAPAEPTAVADGGPVPPTRLLAVFPNPVRGAADVRFTLAETGPVRLAVYDAGGRLREVLLDGTREAGEHRLRWSPDALPAGAYFARLGTREGTRTFSFVVTD
jgi:hypothetical protein